MKLCPDCDAELVPDCAQFICEALCGYVRDEWPEERAEREEREIERRNEL